MADSDRHVVPHADGGWDVKAPHAERASSHHETQAEAIARAREIVAHAGGGELVVHAADGHIRESDTVAAATAHASAAHASAEAPAGSAATDTPGGGATSTAAAPTSTVTRPATDGPGGRVVDLTDGHKPGLLARVREKLGR